MSTAVTWPGGATDPTATAYAVPAAGELNWAALSSFLVALGQSAQGTSFQKFAVRKATATPVTGAVTDCIIECKLAAPGAVTVNLPAGAAKQVLFVLDGTGDAATNNVTVARNGTDTIRGATSYVITQNYGWVMLAFNSTDTDWKVVAEGSRISSLTASRALVSNSAGNVAVSTVSTTQLQYLASATGTTGTTSTNVVFSTSPSIATPTFTGLITATGSSGMAMGANALYGLGVSSFTNNTAQSFTPTNANGIFIIYSRTPTYKTNVYGMYAYQCNAATIFLQAISNTGSSMAVSTSVLAGTTGTPGNFTISTVASDPKIYMENQLGGTIAIHYMVIGA